MGFWRKSGYSVPDGESSVSDPWRSKAASKMIYRGDPHPNVTFQEVFDELVRVSVEIPNYWRYVMMSRGDFLDEHRDELLAKGLDYVIESDSGLRLYVRKASR